MKGDYRPAASHLIALFVLSASTLAFEVLLLRVFEYSHWHHFAGLAVALALLGLGAAGTVLALLGGRPVVVGDGWYVLSILIAAAGLLLVIVVQSQVALRPLLAGWDARELGRLLLVDTVAFLPFFGTGLAIGHVFLRWPQHTAQLYAVNLLGSGTGSIAASLCLVYLELETAMAVIAVLLALTGVGLAVTTSVKGSRHTNEEHRSPWRMHLRRTLPALLVMAAIGPVAVRPPAPAVSEFKPLAQLLELPDVQLLERLPGLRGPMTSLRSQSLRLAPGLSIVWPTAVPVVDALVIGSDRVVALPRRWPGESDSQAASLVGLPLLLRPNAQVLALGSGTWGPSGRQPGATLIWVEPDARILAQARQRGAQAAGLQAHTDSPQHYLATTGKRFDVIAIDAAYEGGDAASEDYLLTQEGLALALSRLNARGLLVIPLRLEYPPRHFARVLNTLERALTHEGAPGAAAQIAVLRGLRSLLVLSSPQSLSARDRESIREFAARWLFDIAWLGDLHADEVNRHHVLQTPVFYQVSRAVLDAGGMPALATRFVTAPADLGSPYIWRTMRWAEIPALLRQLGARGWSYLDWTLLLSLAGGLTVCLLAFAFVLAPLGRLPGGTGALGRGTVLVYFSALGVGYMLLELAIFQRSILYLGEPVLAASVVFAAFMLGSGVGSASAPVLCRRRTVVIIFAALSLAGLLAVLGLWRLGGVIVELPSTVRIALVVALIAPLSWAMGRPFPWALRQLAGHDRWIPWAWGVNGFASVFAASVATLLSVQWGQLTTVLIGAGCYAIAFAVALRWAAAVAIQER